MWVYNMVPTIREKRKLKHMSVKTAVREREAWKKEGPPWRLLATWGILRNHGFPVHQFGCPHTEDDRISVRIRGTPVRTQMSMEWSLSKHTWS